MILLPATLTLLMIGEFLVYGAEVCEEDKCERCCSKKTVIKRSNNLFIFILQNWYLTRWNFSTDVTEEEPQGNYTLPRKYRAYPCIKFAYKVHLDAYRNSTQAESICQSEGAHLAVIDSESKLKYAQRIPIPRVLGIRHVGMRLGDDEWVSVVDGKSWTRLKYLWTQTSVDFITLLVLYL